MENFSGSWRLKGEYCYGRLVRGIFEGIVDVLYGRLDLFFRCKIKNIGDLIVRFEG